MTLKDLQKIQAEFDAKHGWATGSDDERILLEKISDDLIGLIGEVGEFANNIKKAKLDLNISKAALDEQRMANLNEEFIDIFIYMMRISSHLRIDIESEYIKKLTKNKKRFVKFENSNNVKV